MDFMTIAKQRCSVRSYTDRQVEQEKLEKILEAAHVAPTAANLQPVRLIAVQSEEGLAKVGKAADIYGAPLAIIVCADHDKAWVRPFDRKQTGDIDASILTDHMMLQATELGLGTVWVCYFKPDVLSEQFELPANLGRSTFWRSDTPTKSPLTRSGTTRRVFRSVIWFPMTSCRS